VENNAELYPIENKNGLEKDDDYEGKPLFDIIDNNSVLGLSTYEHDRCFVKQINYITLFYCISLFMDTSLW